MASFPENLRDLRKRFGLSQEEFAESVESSRPQVARWEAGNASPHPATLRRIAERFGITIPQLVGDEPLPATPAPSRDTPPDLKMAGDTTAIQLAAMGRDVDIDTLRDELRGAMGVLPPHRLGQVAVLVQKMLVEQFNVPPRRVAHPQNPPPSALNSPPSTGRRMMPRPAPLQDKKAARKDESKKPKE